ncbi:MAG: tetratricopeptide repeat protein [Bacteroidales bacterium]|nr:tetratricopeptide repeat protein [Bacteroidales bacterium]
MNTIRIIGLAISHLIIGVCSFYTGHAQMDGDNITIGTFRVMHSSILDEDRLLYIHLPRDYESTRISYPVMYILYSDLYNYFCDAAMASERLGSTGEVPQLILVGVANTNRYRDLLPYAIPGSPDSGGAGQFLRFLEEELVPFIDSAYRTEDYKILAGPQAAAVFGLYALIKRPGFFNGILTENPFMNPENADSLFPVAERFFKGTDTLKTFLYISCHKDERPRDLEYAEKLAGIMDLYMPVDFRFEVKFSEPSGYFIPPLPFAGILRKLFVGHKLPADYQVNDVEDIIHYYKNLTEEYGFVVNPPDLVLAFQGDRLNQQGKARKAIGVFEYQLSLNSSSLNAIWQLGETYRGLGEYEKAAEYYRRFLDIRDVDAAMIHFRLSQVEKIINNSAAYHIGQEIFDHGIQAGLAEYEIIRSDPESGLYFDEGEMNALGYRLMKQGKVAEAIEIFRINVALYPESANVYDSLAEAYLINRDEENAVINYRKSLELNPGNENARESLERIERK